MKIILNNNALTVSVKEGDVQLACQQVANKIKDTFGTPFDHQTGLYLATPDAGIAASVAFWKEAIEEGPGFVGPRLFPWTLANGPATCLARLLGVKGPNITLIGDQNTVKQLKKMKKEDLGNNRIKNALVIYFDSKNVYVNLS